MTATPGGSPDLAVHLRRARGHVDRHVADDLDLDRPEGWRGVEVPLRPLLRGRVRRDATATCSCGAWWTSGGRPAHAERPYGVEAVMRDVSGNWLVLVERRDFTPADFA